MIKIKNKKSLYYSFVQYFDTSFFYSFMKQGIQVKAQL